MASIPTHGSGSQSAHRTLEASGRAAVAASSGSSPSVGMKRIITGGPKNDMRSEVATVNKSSIRGHDKGEGGGA